MLRDLGLVSDPLGLVRRQPLKDLGQLPHLANEREHQVLGSMKLPPVALIRELAKVISDLLLPLAAHISSAVAGRRAFSQSATSGSVQWM